MCSVTDQGDAALWRYPGWERVAIDKLPVYEAVWWCGADDGVDFRAPVFEALDCVFDLARGGPGLFDVCLVFVRADPAEVLAVLDGCGEEVDVRP